MRFKLTILLAVLNVAIFSLIFYVDRVQSARNLFENSSRLILDPAFVQGLQSIRISSNRSGEEWHLVQRDNGGWDVDQPIHWKANPFAVQQLLFQLKALSWESRFPVESLAAAGQSLESYDLASPPLQIHLSNGTTSLTLSIGAPTEIGNRLYTLSPDADFVLVIGRGLRDSLQKDPEAFLDKRLFGEGTRESRVISIQDRSASNVRVRMQRGADGWRFVSPIEAEADDERVQALLSEWQSTEGSRFRQAAAGEDDFGGQTLSLTLEGLSSRETIHFDVEGTSSEQAYYPARREGYEAIFAVEKSKVDELRRVQDALREKRILHRYADDWSSLEIRNGSMVTTLQQLENGEWQVLSTNEEGQLTSRPADPGVVNDVRSLFNTMEAVRFVSDAPSENDLVRFGLDDPQRRILLRRDNGTAIEFNIGGISREEDETLLYGSTNQEASVFLLRPHILASLPLSPLHYRERTLLELPATTQFGNIAIEDLSTQRIKSFFMETDPAIVTQISGYLRNVEVERFLNQPFTNPLKLDATTELPWAFRLTASPSVPQQQGAGTESIDLYLSERLGGTTQYVGYAESGLVGILPADIIELLDPLLVEFPEVPGPPSDSPEIEETEPGT